MNVTELARRLRTNTKELFEHLPEMGFDIGKRAIKVDSKVAKKIMETWPVYQAELRAKRKAEAAAKEQEMRELENREVYIPASITVKEFAELLDLPVTKVIQVLMNNGILAALNEKIDYETASIIAEDLGITPHKKSTDETEEANTSELIKETHNSEKKDLSPRPPVVVIMGHVDHGKTKLLDTIRKADVVAGEAGGITQHIGAYQVTKTDPKTKEKKKITFIDTPGHEAFTTMRSRGAKTADIAILVVAADDGVKVQTIEAIKIAKAAQLPLIVAINKIDKPEANLDKVKSELSEHDLIPEDWGGKTICVPISALEGKGIDTLLETILLVADMEQEQITANAEGKKVAVVIESNVDSHTGPVATLLVQNGTFKTGDNLVIDNILYGKIRAMKNHHGKIIKTAPPSTPMRIIGLKAAPVIGYSMEGYTTLPKGVDKKTKPTASQAVVVTPKKKEKDEDLKSVNVIIKADTLGSLEAIANSLLKIDHPEVKVKITSKDLGHITSSDVLNAEATNSFIAGFHVAAQPAAEEMAREKEVEINYYKVIYELIDEVKSRIEKLLSPTIEIKVVGQAKVLAIFKTNPKSMILGGVATHGTFKKDLKARVLRDGTEVTHGKITELQLGKQEAKEVTSGQEFGMQFKGNPDIQKDDIIEVYVEEAHDRKLEDEEYGE